MQVPGSVDAGASAVGLFYLSGRSFSGAYEARAFGTKTNHVGWATVRGLFIGSRANTIARSSRYFVILLWRLY